MTRRRKRRTERRRSRNPDLIINNCGARDARGSGGGSGGNTVS